MKWLGAAVLAVAAAAAHAAPVVTPHVTAELIAERAAVRPGEALAIGLRLQHIPGWHTYWRNPGDSGLPTTLAWMLPPGSRVGEIDWPAPRRLPAGPLVNFGYDGDLLLPLAFTAPADASPGRALRLSAKADWLVCSDVCIPESATLALELPVVEAGAAVADGAHAARFARTRAAQPQPWPAGARATLQQAGREALLTFAFGGAPAGGAPVQVFPYAEQRLKPARHEVWRTADGYAIRLALMDGAALPPVLSGIVVRQGDRTAPWGGARALEFSAPVQAVAALALPAGAQPMAATDAHAAPAAADATSAGVLASLALAFAGGLLLNLMPCVFPVLAIKLLGLAQPAPHAASNAALRAHAGGYALGVVGSFLALAGVLLALRAAGQAVGWGFQLQEPGIVFVLALLFFALGLNLIGAFEFRLVLPGRVAGWRSAHPGVDAFASGVLAVVAASPCSAPFMGAALGLALVAPAGIALALFGALGLGMALPYVLLVLLPGWRARLPRPGAWMQQLKQALAFPMFLSVVWLAWVLGQQAGIDAIARLLLALVALAALVWLARWPVAGDARTARAARTVLAAAAMVAVLAWSWPAANADAAAGAAVGSAAPADASGRPEAGAGSAWSPYDETLIAQHLAQGRPVFVDFTAAWCVSCQVNKRLVLNTAATQQAFAQAGVALMRADWTRRDDAITRALARLGRNGVPVYALMAPGRPPVLLPEILTERIVRDALAALATASLTAAERS